MTDGLALLTDLYQLTMACGYWKSGQADREAVFHLTFRRPPFPVGLDRHTHERKQLLIAELRQ